MWQIFCNFAPQILLTLKKINKNNGRFKEKRERTTLRGNAQSG